MVEYEIDYSSIIGILEDIFGDYRFHNDYKGQISFDCPVCSYDIKGLECGDGKSNLEINYKHNVFKCWVCSETHDTHGSLYKLIKRYGNPKQLKKYTLLRPDDNDDYRKKNYKQIKLPKEFISFKNVSSGLKLTPHYKQAFNYIKNRNITPELIDKYNIGFCYEGPYENRIIIPSYDSEDRINYFIARSYLTKTKLKYKNPDIDKETLIWNEHLINWNERIYIVEGAFDSIFLPNSIPMLGKFMTQHLFNKLYDNTKKDVVIVLDPDAWRDSEKLYHRLNCGKLMGKILTIKLEGNKDIADLKGDLSDYIPKKLD
jgi:Zn-finger nucleic acid-binding protein